MICKDTDVINVITIQEKKLLIPVNFDGSHYANLPNKSPVV
jgi:hypothetical protein